MTSSKSEHFQTPCRYWQFLAIFQPRSLNDDVILGRSLFTFCRGLCRAIRKALKFMGIFLVLGCERTAQVFFESFFINVQCFMNSEKMEETKSFFHRVRSVGRKMKSLKFALKLVAVTAFVGPRGGLEVTLNPLTSGFVSEHL